MICLNCSAKNSYGAKRCRRCKANPRKAGRGFGSHHEISPMGHATKTKNAKRENSRKACRDKRAEDY